MKKACALASVAAALVWAFPASAQSLNKDVRRAYESIQPMKVYSYCKTLCLPKYEGRFTGSESFTECARWAASMFRQWGLKPVLPGGQYLQPFPSPYSIIEQAEMTLYLPVANEEEPAAEKHTIEKGLRELKLKPGVDFFPLLFSDGGEHTADLVFVGWGIHAPDLDYDDYAGVEAKGKFALCFRGTPDRKDRRFMEHDQHRTRMRTAKEKGASGILYIHEKTGANPNGERIEGFMPATLAERLADQIFAEHGLTSAALRKELGESKRPHSLTLHSRIKLSVKARYHADATGYNVVAALRGNDAELENECVIVGAHMDHCGLHAGRLFTGAQDNASGTAAVMAAAEAFSRLSTPPRRSVVFVLFGGEEMGLLGSTHLAKHLPLPLTEVHGMFNLDMVGTGDRARFGYRWDHSELKKTIEQADEVVKTLQGSAWAIRRIGVRSSDFAPFFKLGAPCANFSSNGPHLHYHQPGDTIYRINPDMLADVARLTFLSSYAWANQ